MARPRGGGGGSAPRQRFPALLGGALAVVTALVPVAAAFVTPTLGDAYLLQQLTFNANDADSAASVGGSFASATFQDTTNPKASQVRRTLVWDARNNSLAYLADMSVIRVLDFANPAAATAVTTLALPGYVGGLIPYIASICADAKLPQTLYVTANYYGGQGKMYAILLDFVNGARLCVRGGRLDADASVIIADARA
jgi:hypothetical protein